MQSLINFIPLHEIYIVNSRLIVKLMLNFVKHGQCILQTPKMYEANYL